MLELRRKTNEVDIVLKYYQSVGGKCKVDILGHGDLSHHLVEELFALVDKLARVEMIGHQSSEWRKD
jgi:hypothetical protein